MRVPLHVDAKLLRNYLKRAVATADDTRGVRKPVAAAPDNSMPSCRSAPVSPDTWTASSRCVPPPTVGRERFSLPVGPASPPPCAGYADSTGRQQRSRGRWDCHTLCPGTGFGCLPGVPLRCSPRSASRVSCHGRWLQPPPRSGVRRLRPPGCSACSQLCPGRWGCVQWRPPNRALPMEQSADCHSQSTPPNSWHSAIRAAQMPASTPHSTQRWKVRCCKVRWMVLSSPNSLGKWFHWQPLRIRKIMPSSIFRWSARLRPLALGGSNCNITGSIRSQRSSGNPK